MKRPQTHQDCQVLATQLKLNSVEVADAFGFPTPLHEELAAATTPHALWNVFCAASKDTRIQLHALERLLEQIVDIDKLWLTHSLVTNGSEAGQKILVRIEAECRKLPDVKKVIEQLWLVRNNARPGSPVHRQATRGICELTELR